MRWKKYFILIQINVKAIHKEEKRKRNIETHVFLTIKLLPFAHSLIIVEKIIVTVENLILCNKFK